MRFPTWLFPDTDIWEAGLRTAVGAGLASLVAYLLALPQGYWAVMTAIIIIQTRVGASIQAAADRTIGTLAGAAFGFAVALLTPTTPLWNLFALIVSTGVLGMLAAHRSSFRIAPMTAAILLVSTPSHAVALISAVHRVSEILIGCAIGIFVSLVVAPARSDAILRNEGNRALGLLAKLIELDVDEEAADEDVTRATSDKIYDSFRTIDTLTKEVREEQASHLSRSRMDPSRLRLGLRDLRTSVLLLHRALSQPWSAPLAKDMAGPTRTVADAACASLLAVGSALAERARPPPMDSLDDAIASFHAICHDKIRQPGGAEDERAAAHASNLGFALEQVRQSLDRLTGIVVDLADGSGQS